MALGVMYANQRVNILILRLEKLRLRVSVPINYSRYLLKEIDIQEFTIMSMDSDFNDLF